MEVLKRSWKVQLTLDDLRSDYRKVGGIED